LWHLGAALERQDKKAEALSFYIKSYVSGEPDPVRRAIIEQLYRKVNGSLEGLDEQIGPGFATSVRAPAPDKPGDTAQPTSARENTPAATPQNSGAQTLHAALRPSSSGSPAPSTETPIATSTAPATEAPSPTPEQSGTSSPAPSSEAPTVVPQPSPALPTESPKATPEPTATASPEAPPVTSPTPEPTPAATPESTPAAAPKLDASPVEKMDKPTPTTVTITGRVKDSNGNPIANVVVVLISPQGTVLASTTDEQGNYSFTVASSSATRSYRIIPSKEGLVFEPVDRVQSLVSEDVKELDFVGTANRKP
jgi:hypothetical protein